MKCKLTWQMLLYKGTVCSQDSSIMVIVIVELYMEVHTRLVQETFYLSPASKYLSMV